MTDNICLNYSLKTPEERRDLVDQIIKQASPSQLTNKYLEILSDYIIDALPKEEKKEKYITTNNRQVTIDKRETSFEELVSKFENGEDGIYNLINGDRNMYLEPKIEITEEDIAEVPGLRELREQIDKIEAAAGRAHGKKKYLLKKQAIEMRQQQYLLKDMWYQPVRSHSASHTDTTRISLDEEVYFDENGDPTSDALVTFFKPNHISAILCNYEMLKGWTAHRYNNDFHYLMRAFDELLERALKKYPAYMTLVQGKQEGLSNADIQKLLVEKHDLHHTVEYISALWRNKIPKIISETAKEEYLMWYYTEVEKGSWKKCSKCGQVKLAHNRFFSKNNTSKDGYYSICKECRNKKTKEKNQ